ncbi:MAG: hypothetical protein JNK37_16460 [Verrucomicrobiales bacterium]|nr:hypothetical protein [Verrucomicrobiales bacterium]
MSEPLRIALVAEGYTDKVVIEAAISSLIGERSYILRLLQPEESLPFDCSHPYTGTGRGWGGVYLWCLDSRQRGDGRVAGDPLFLAYDILIIHLDADVADKRYSDYGFDDPSEDLPCDCPCPPASATTGNLRMVLVRWMGEIEIPPKTVVCTPSKCTETWVLAALCPDDRFMKSRDWECYPTPQNRLASLPKDRRITKSIRSYRDHFEGMKSGWPEARALLAEAERFSQEFLNVV